MTAILTTAITLTLSLSDDWRVPTPDPVQHGLATFYGDGVMAQVAANRGLIRYPGEFRTWLEDNGYPCAVAMNHAGDLGRTVWIQPEGGVPLGPCPVLDCAQLVHYPDRLDQGRIVEVDYATAMAWGMIAPIRVTVWFSDPIDWKHQPQ